MASVAVNCMESWLQAGRHCPETATVCRWQIHMDCSNSEVEGPMRNRACVLSCVPPPPRCSVSLQRFLLDPDFQSEWPHLLVCLACEVASWQCPAKCSPCLCYTGPLWKWVHANRGGVWGQRGFGAGGGG